MLKVFGFVRRHPSLTHDEYRAGHVGYHNSFGRRLNNIRGYILNVSANRQLREVVDASWLSSITRNEPPDFGQRWDGWGQLLFDSLEDYLAAKAPAKDHAGPDGLEHDPKVTGVGGDGDQLYGGSPFQFHVEEHVIKPVERPEQKLFKLVQFIKPPQGLAPELFRAYLTGRYSHYAATFPTLTGLIVNFRTSLDVMTGFFPPDAEGFTPDGAAIRNEFYGCWDAMVEYWFVDPQGWYQGRSAHSVVLDALEDEIAERSFYTEVDETVAVLPNRAPTPDYYFR